MQRHVFRRHLSWPQCCGGSSSGKSDDRRGKFSGTTLLSSGCGSITGSAFLAPVAESRDCAPASYLRGRPMTHVRRDGTICGQCELPMPFVTVIARVTEPGKVRLFQCHECEKIEFRPE